MISLTNEILRKAIHLSNLVVPLFLFYYGRDLTLYILIPVTFFCILLDLLRIKNQKVRDFYNIFFKSITREQESAHLTGASYVFMASTITIILFPETIAIAALMIMSISDTFAAIIGRTYGSIIIRGKSLEGSISFLIKKASKKLKSKNNLISLYSILNFSVVFIYKYNFFKYERSIN